MIFGSEPFNAGHQTLTFWPFDHIDLFWSRLQAGSAFLIVDNLNSQLISNLPTEFRNSLNSKEFYFVLLSRIKWELPVTLHPCDPLLQPKRQTENSFSLP